MLLVAVEFEVAPEDREAFAAHAAALGDASRGEDGCHFFEIWSDLPSSGRFLAHEGWTDLAALEAHRVTPHVEAFRAAAGSLIRRASASYWDAEETTA